MPSPTPRWSLEALRDVIARHWGFHSFRPLQQPAMQAVLDGRDSLVVMPTGGGKSLCYQAPAVLRGGTTVVISPLISLMKDQVDSLRQCGVPAAQIDSSLTATERVAYEMDVRQGAVRLLFVSPERLVLTDFYRLLQEIGVVTFAIDEAHCISHWGHDFRQEYRQLNRLKELFPKASVHGYTATATEQVRRDIVQQLGLRDPEVLVGNFDRSNLTYRVLPRRDVMKQTLEVLGRHPKEAGIIYCIRRRDVDDLTASLLERGIRVMSYHAGLSADQRRAAQEAFKAEKCDLIVATVAFGMGIDRSNIRFVLHTGMPKSVEHYQQETGRAGRDGLEAECVLLHSGQDFLTWKFILEKSASDPGVDASFLPGALRHVEDMDRFCRGAVCRHQALVRYFGQELESESCRACDICLGDAEPVADGLVIAQKILSCVARVKERFGAGQVIDVLHGSNTEKVRKFNHHELSTFGLLRDKRTLDIRDWINQLVGQNVLVQEEIQLLNGKRAPILKLNAGSWEVMKGQRSVRLMESTRREKGEKPSKSRADTVSWEGVDRELFESLRELRRQLAEERGVPPYIIFSDATLRELARMRPSSLERMRFVYGIGDAKLRDFGASFLRIVHEHAGQRSLSRDNPPGPTKAELAPPAADKELRATSLLTFELFRRGASIEEVVEKTGRTRGTVFGYLEDFIRHERPAEVRAWVADDVYARIAAAVREVGDARLKPVFLALGEKVPYDEIRLVMAHLKTGAPK